MKRTIIARLAVPFAALLLATGCESGGVAISGVTGSFVDSFSIAGQVILPGATNAHIGSNSTTYSTDSFSGSRIVQIVFNAKFTGVTSSAQVGSDDYLHDVFSAIAKGATLTAGGQTIDRLYGFWPKKASKNSATQATLFYLVPANTKASDLQWTMDGTVLGDATYQYTFTDFSETAE